MYNSLWKNVCLEDSRKCNSKNSSQHGWQKFTECYLVEVYGPLGCILYNGWDKAFACPLPTEA